LSAARTLIDALSDEYWQVRLKAARSLGILKIVQAVPAIGAGLDHPQANLRKECAAALGEIADPAGRSVLEPHSADPDPDVRKNVQWALQRISISDVAAR
jgi:HEAT repeat protein